ncbi:MAG: anthranilate phosphoribosyltransferase [Bryobacterales bacterium]|nr:anthranilate phosphoribosyltransferase [Bryobacterales bacterium]MCZ2148495.1 anthranilate phosphoribosyltransferase [Bryobacterales bacterium]
MSIVPFLHRVVAREDLTVEEAREAMLSILSGESTNAQIAAFVTALRMKGETGAEILGFARAMGEKGRKVEVGLGAEPLIDTCGTGGDGGGTFNISTIAAFVVAGAGARVAKHGNRSLSSQCGSADLLEELGLPVEVPLEVTARAIREVGIGFLFAPALHPAMRYAQPVRGELKMRTAFNLLGPLCNPAGATAQLIGAPSMRSAELMAEALSGLGIGRAWVVHGADGLDEITTTTGTHVFEVRESRIRRMTVTPEDFGVRRVRADEIRGGDRAANAAIARSVLRGDRGPQRDIVVVNAAAALLVAGAASSLEEAVAQAEKSIDERAAFASLSRLCLLLSWAAGLKSS